MSHSTGPLHKSSCGGEGTGKNPTDRGKLGWKWSVLTDRNGTPIGSTIEGANRNDSVLFAPTLDDAAERGLLDDIEIIWLDRGYDSDAIRQRLAGSHLHDAVIARKSKRGSPEPKKNQPMGLRWPVERTNSWLSNFGQLRRDTDRKTAHRLAPGTEGGVTIHLPDGGRPDDRSGPIRCRVESGHEICLWNGPFPHDGDGQLRCSGPR